MTGSTGVGKRIEELGAIARLAGKKLEDNPYKWAKNFGERNHRVWWTKGWEHEDAEIKAGR